MGADLDPARILAREEARSRQAIAHARERLAGRTFGVTKLASLFRRHRVLTLAGAAVVAAAATVPLRPLLRRAPRLAAPAARGLGLLLSAALRTALRARPEEKCG